MENILTKINRDIERARWNHNLVEIAHLVAYKSQVERFKATRQIEYPVPVVAQTYVGN